MVRYIKILFLPIYVHNFKKNNEIGFVLTVYQFHLQNCHIFSTYSNKLFLQYQLNIIKLYGNKNTILNSEEILGIRPLILRKYIQKNTQKEGEFLDVVHSCRNEISTINKYVLCYMYKKKFFVYMYT